MADERDRRAGEPGRRPEPIVRDGTPRHELAYWLRAALAEHGDATLDRIHRALPDEVRLSRSALGKALRGETFPDLALVRAVLAAVGAERPELDAWTSYWNYLDHLETLRRRGEAVHAHAPRWGGGRTEPETPASTPAQVPARVPGPPAPEPSRQSWAFLVVGVVVGFLLTLGVTAIHRAVTDPTPVPGQPQATIVLPNTTSVPRTFRLQGFDRDLPPGTLLWSSTFDPATTQRFFPQDKPCVTRTDGTFDCGQYYLGKQDAPDTATYRIDVLVADAAASNTFLQYQIDKGGPDGPSPGLAAMPPGATILFSRYYTRV